MSDARYAKTLRELQIELVKLQRHMIDNDYKILVLLEGRDAAGKDGVIKRIVEHLSPRNTRVVALGKPSDRDASAWYFQRYVSHLPTADEFVLFNRSWYNRAGVERVMGFCTEAEYEEFMATVLDFERMLVGSGIRLLKYYLDISKAEQKKRLADRRADPLTQWKISPIDAIALKKWKAYSAARDEMLRRTHNPVTPWTIVAADDKKAARLNLIRDLLTRLPYDGKKLRLLKVDPTVVYPYGEDCHADGRIAP
jgi:polyphosphate kinase 2